MSPLLLELLENALHQYPMNEAPEDTEDDTAGTEDTAEDQTDAGADDNAEDQSDDTGEEETPDDNNENEEDNNENNEEGEGEGGEDEFSFSGDEEEEDSGPNPDGLPDPDNTGDDTAEDEAEEKNIQINILNISELDRLLLKRKILHSYQDLRTMINSFRTTIDQRETRLEPEIREMILSELIGLHAQIGTYITTRFPLVNYEESLQTFALFTKRFNEIIQLTNGDDKHDNKGSKK